MTLVLALDLFLMGSAGRSTENKRGPKPGASKYAQQRRHSHDATHWLGRHQHLTTKGED
jgi:hypothetical protein